MRQNIVALLPVLCQVDVLSKPASEPAEPDRIATVLQAKLDALQMQVHCLSLSVLTFIVYYGCA